MICLNDFISGESFRLIVKEAVWRNGRNNIHDEVVYRMISGMYQLRYILEHIIDAFNAISFAQHDFISKEHQLFYITFELYN